MNSRTMAGDGVLFATARDFHIDARRYRCFLDLRAAIGHAISPARLGFIRGTAEPRLEDVFFAALDIERNHRIIASISNRRKSSINMAIDTESARPPQTTENATSTAIRTPSRWVTRFAPVAARHNPRPACGGGRNGCHFRASGHGVTFSTKYQSAPGSRRNLAGDRLRDLETGALPLQDRQFDGVVVTNYPWRDIQRYSRRRRARRSLDLRDIGTGNEAYGRPRNPDFLEPGELPETVGTVFVPND